VIDAKPEFFSNLPQKIKEETGESLNSALERAFVKRAAAVVLLSGLIALLTLGLSGCSSGSSAQPIGVSVTSSVAGNAIDQGQTVSLTASVRTTRKTPA